MVDVCFYFQVHQPYRLGQYSVFDTDSQKHYFHTAKNREVLKRVARKSYLPTNKILLGLLKKHPEFKISYSISGVALEQFEEYAPQVLQSFQELNDTGQVEMLSETYYHSLAFLYSKKEFDDQVKLHRDKIRKLFKQRPRVFRNTELIYTTELAHHVQGLGYKGILAEGWDPILGWRSPNFVYRPAGANISLLLKNYRLSDDIAFRFSNQGWKEWPLSCEKYASWVNSINGNGEIVNLFMDYETFGEHQWAQTGIFNFLQKLPEELLNHQDNSFLTPSEVIKKHKPVDEVHVDQPLSWADTDRDISAWLGNSMQHKAAHLLFELEHDVRKLKSKKLLDTWRKLQTSDHLYYMCTKWFGDGDVHTYFSPYDSPYDAFITFMNVLNDFKRRLHLAPMAPIQ